MKLLIIACASIVVAACTPNDKPTPVQGPNPQHAKVIVIPAADVQTPIAPPATDIQSPIAPMQAADTKPAVDAQEPAKPSVSADKQQEPLASDASPKEQKVCIESGKCRVLKIHKKHEGVPVPK